MNKKKIYYLNIILIEIIVAMFIISIISLGRQMGCFSRLRYTNLWMQSNQSQTEILQIISVDIDESYEAYLADEEVQELSETYMLEISKFLRKQYKVVREIPEYKMYVSDKIDYAVTVIDENGNVCIIISNKYMKFSKKTLDPIIIHELFHVYNAYDGVNSVRYNGEYIASSLVEGYTDILTDEFCEYYGYDYNKRVGGKEYRYYSYLVEIFLESNEYLFQNYYFYKDTTIAISLNHRLRENALVSKNFDVFSYYERELKDFLSEDNENSKNNFLATLEVTLYYLKDEEDTIVYSKYLNNIIKWYNENYPDNQLSERQIEYLNSILSNKNSVSSNVSSHYFFIN